MPGTLVLYFTNNKASGVSCRVAGRTYCDIFLNFSIFFLFFLFFLFRICLLLFFALHLGFCPYTIDIAPSFLRARRVNERQGRQ